MATLTVVVYDSYTRLLLIGVDVSLYVEATGANLGVMSNYRGEAAFPGIPASRVTVSMEPPGYVPHSEMIGFGGLEDAEHPVALIPEGVEPPAEGIVNLGFHVRNVSGTPIVGATVTLYGVGERVTAWPSGIALFMGVAETVYDWSAAAEGFNEASGEVDTTQTADLYVTLTAVGAPPPPPMDLFDLTVAVTVEGAGPLAGQFVQAAREEGGYAASGATGEDGLIIFRGIPAGWVGVLINDVSRRVNLLEDSVLEVTVPAPYTPPSGWTVTVRCVFEDGAPGSGVDVTLQGVDVDETRRTGSDGVATFTDVPAGSYAVAAGVISKTVSVTRSLTVTLLGVKRPEIPIVHYGPSTLKAGFYEWKITFNIAPIPFLSRWVADIQAGALNDEAEINRLLAGSGFAGSATVLDKKVDVHYTWGGVSADYFTVTYKLAITEDAALGAETLIAPLVGAIILKLLSLAIAIVATFAVLSVVSYLQYSGGPGEYKPLKPGECAPGYVYDEEKDACVKSSVDTGKLLLYGGVAVGAVVILSAARGRGGGVTIVNPEKSK